MTDAPVTVYRLAVRCPKCRTPPALRVTAAEVEGKADLPPDQLVQSYQCQNRRCFTGLTPTIYWIAASAYQRAVPVRGAA